MSIQKLDEETTERIEMVRTINSIIDFLEKYPIANAEIAGVVPYPITIQNIFPSKEEE